jgi:hypothetical protein
MRLRSTPMNQRKVIPVKGTRFSARRTQFRKEGPASHKPGSVGSAGTASLINTKLIIYSTANMMPLIATIRGGDGTG